jgi:hypothetical protein
MKQDSVVPCLKEHVEKNATKEKAQVTWASKENKGSHPSHNFSFVNDVHLPSFTIFLKETMSEKMITHFHKMNELYNGILNAIHSYAFGAVALDMSNKVFPYTKAMQHSDSAQFTEAMSKEIYDHESKDHWEIMRCSTISPGHKTIQAI